MLRHGRLLFGRLTGQTARSQERTRRSASLHGKSHGGPRSLVAAKDGTKWRAMLRHGRLFFGRLTGQTAKPQKRTRRSASLHGKSHGGPRPLVATKDGTKWRAMLCHGRLFFGRLTGQTAKPQKRTRRSASLHGKSHGGPRSLVAAKDGTKWRAMLCHGRLFFGRLTGQTAKPQKTDATERVPPGMDARVRRRTRPGRTPRGCVSRTGAGTRSGGPWARIRAAWLPVA